MRDLNRDWFPENGDKPSLNTWYPCKRGDDYWKIILQSHSTKERTTLYRVVSMRGADVGFDLTLSMARVMIMKETRRAS